MFLLNNRSGMHTTIIIANVPALDIYVLILQCCLFKIIDFLQNKRKHNIYKLKSILMMKSVFTVFAQRTLMLWASLFVWVVRECVK